MLPRLFVVLASLVAAAPATAGDIAVTLGTKAGTLHARAPRVVLGATVTVPVKVVDARGSGAGWRLHVGGGGTIVGVTARCATHSTCTLPRGRMSSDTLYAVPHSGMGAIELAVTVSGGRGVAGVSIR